VRIFSDHALRAHTIARLILSISSITPSLTSPVPTSISVEMGFSFKGLTTSALVNGAVPNQHANERDIADVPAAIDGHTSMDVSRRPDEKIGAPRTPTSISESDDEELNKVDTHAEQGVQAIQAVTFVWSKRDLILAYIL
jgi:hypothetical protein